MKTQMAKMLSFTNSSDFFLTRIGSTTTIVDVMTTSVVDGFKMSRQPKSPELAALSAGQMEVMEIVWKHNEISAVELTELLNAKRKISKNAVKTNLDRIEEKGWITHRVIGRTFFYRALVAPDQGLTKRLSTLLDRVCGGDPRKLMAAFLDTRPMTSSEIEELESLIRQAKQSNNAKGK